MRTRIRHVRTMRARNRSYVDILLAGPVAGSMETDSGSREMQWKWRSVVGGILLRPWCCRTGLLDAARSTWVWLLGSVGEGWHKR